MLGVVIHRDVATVVLNPVTTGTIPVVRLWLRQCRHARNRVLNVGHLKVMAEGPILPVHERIRFVSRHGKYLRRREPTTGIRSAVNLKRYVRLVLVGECGVL